MEASLKRTAEETQNGTVPIKRTQAVSSKSIKETDVGIAQYINEIYKDGGGFFGTIKERYSDFQVFEIDTKGNVVHLTDTGIDLGVTAKDRRLEKRQNERADLQNLTPEELAAAKQEKAEKTEKAEEDKKDEEVEQEKAPKYTLKEADRENLLTFITAEELQEIEDLFGNGGNMTTKTAFADKTKRTQLHQLFRQAFDGKVETLTSPDNRFKIALSKKDAPMRRNTQINHVDDAGVVNYGLGPYKPYLHFTVYKENRETMEVASTLTKFLRVPNKSVKYSGTKDRRGVTCQRFSIHHGKVARVSALNKGLKGFVLGGFSYEDRSLDLGDLEGNEFIITIRDVRSHDEGADLEASVKSSFESLREKGYINYYGLQRFGTFSISTHALGILLLKEDWKGAAELILAEQDRVVPDSVEARRVWAATGDASAASKLMPRWCNAESAILNMLAKEKRAADGYSQNAYFRAIMQIPRNLRLIYVHAYQSYVWNLVASKRVELFGLEVQPGDLVMTDQKMANSSATTEIVDGVEFAEDVADTASPKVRALTPEDIESGKYTVYDVVLPSPGFDVIYPANATLMEVYKTAMAKDGLDPHSMARRVKEFSLSGSYRPLMGRATNLTYDIVNYEKDTDSLVRTDLELLAAKRDGVSLERVVASVGKNVEESAGVKETEGNEGVEEKKSGDNAGEDKKEGEETGESAGAGKTAVILRMRLGVSSYATMALREFMKADTS